MKRVRIGRSKDNDFIISKSIISSNHAELIQYNDSKVTVRDLNSMNGTYVNGKRISTETVLYKGDIVKLANEQIDWCSIINGIIDFTPTFPSNTVKKVLLGRGAESGKIYSQKEVSSKHATLYRTQDGIRGIVDNNSTNGTYVNGKRVSHAVLHKGDVVSLARIVNVDWEKLLPVKNVNIIAKYVAVFIGIFIILGGGYFLYNKISHPQPETPIELSAEEIYAKYKKSVVLIHNQYTFRVTIGEYNLSDVIKNVEDQYNINEKGEICTGVQGMTGTGFFVSTDGKIVTNKHVVTLMGHEQEIADFIRLSLSNAILKTYGDKARNIVNAMRVRYVSSLSIAMNDAYLQSEKDLIPCTLLKASDNNDLDVAVIQINTKQTPSAVENIVDISNVSTDNDIAIGKKLYTIGFPRGLSWGQTQQGLQATNESGTVNQNVSEFLYGHNINITHGASGSPVFDTKGKFAGVIVSGYEYRTLTSDGNITTIPAQHNQAIKPVPVANFVKTQN